MYRLDTTLVRSALLIAAVIFSCSLGLAAEEQPENLVASTKVRATGISWAPLIEFEQAVLTISGPGDVSFRKEFAKGDALRLDVLDKSIGALMDGQYSWDLRFMPLLEPTVKKALREARDRGDSLVEEELKRKGVLPVEPYVESGFFRVKDGSIILDDRAEARVRPAGRRVEADASSNPEQNLPTKQLITGDLTVHNNLCVGFDCLTAESYGFETIKLKENNLRILFDDTSASASFPDNDWQLTANDSANGGANKFSIDDISNGKTPFTIEENAPTNSLFVEDSGDIGFGTSAPVVDLHMVEGDSPTLRLEQDGSSGFTPQTWDLAGNETNFFIRDVTNGSLLPFRIKPAAPTNSIFVAASGYLGIGTASPATKFHIENTSGDDDDDFVVNEDGRVGVGTISPVAPLDIEGSATSIGFGNAVTRMANSAGGVAFQFNADSDTTFWNMSSLGGDSQFRISRSGTGNTEMFLTSSGNLSVFGDLSIGGTCAGCDAVFQPGYNLETIEEHAELMWENSHLPAVGPTQDGRTRISVFEKTTGMLNELEKAHVYIERLHMRLQQQEQAIEDLREQFKELERAASTP